MKINAQLETIKSRFDYAHDIDEAKVADIIAHWDTDIPPLLVVRDTGNGAYILDGHHRAEAAKRLEIETVKAWVVERDAFETLIAEDWDGDIPDRLSDLDVSILCAGKSYERK